MSIRKSPKGRLLRSIHVLPHRQQQAAQTMDAILLGDEPLGSIEGSKPLSSAAHE
jgi:hypothetical protein